MDDRHFDTLVRRLSGGATRRGVLGALAGIAGLQITETQAERRPRKKRRLRARRQRNRQQRVRPAQLVTIRQGCPENPPTEIAILHALGLPGYWWDHTDLTVAVQAHPKVGATHLAAVREAIAIWNQVLAEDPDLNIITLTDVTDKLRPANKADIRLHYVPRAGGVVFGGVAICQPQRCNNVIVRSDLPPALGEEQYSPEYLGWVTLHELGHALGLGHAEPLLETNDLMGYNWPPLAPVLSPCDLRGLREVWAWAIEGVDPYPPDEPFVDCSDLCRQ